METRVWIDDLIWCPSQCYYYFETKSNERYCIYLRWRHSNPWTASLVYFNGDDWDWDNTTWIPLTPKKDYKDNELDELKLDIMRQTFRQFKGKIKKKGD